MEPPPTQSIETIKTFELQGDERDKAVNDCCSCCYDCTESCFDYLFCNLC